MATGLTYRSSHIGHSLVDHPAASLSHSDTVSCQWAARDHEDLLGLDAVDAMAGARQWALRASSMVMQHGKHKNALPAGLEPAIFGLEVRRLVH